MRAGVTLCTYRMRPWTKLPGVVGIACLAWSCHTQQPARRMDLPGLMLWAWERPEDLRFLDPHHTGVAFLAGTAVIASNGSVVFRLRTQSLALSPGTAVMPVVRIESPAMHAPAAMLPLLAGLRDVAKMPGVRGLQIDFDARRSERGLYRALLAATSQQTATGITALASWCSGDRWLEREPLAEVVPMFFRMGRGESREMPMRSAVCLGSMGLSIDEAWPSMRPAAVQRIYLFSPKAWTPEAYFAARRRLEAWQ